MRIIVIGAGQVGYHIAETLSNLKHDVTVIELDDGLARKVDESLDVHVVIGSGSHPEVLKQAGIENADMLIAVTERDEVNMIACLIASFQSKIAKKIARIRDEAYGRNFRLLIGAPLEIDLFIHPEQEAAIKAISLIEVPGASDVVSFEEGRVVLAGAPVSPKSPWIGRRILEIGSIGDKRGKVLIVAIHREERLVIPRGKDTIKAGDELFFIAEQNQLSPVLEDLGRDVSPTRRVFVTGGTKVALNIARELETRSINTKIICKDPDLCEQLGEEFHRLMVLVGEGTDQRLLLEENIRDVDVFIAAAEDEEENILSALLAKQLGAKRTMALASRLSYVSLLNTLGVDVVLNPRIAAVNRILRYIRRGKVLNVATMGGDQAEALEIEALDTSDIVNRPIRDIRFPKDAIIGAVIREEKTIIPHGETVIEPGDRVIIIAARDAVPRVEKALTVKLEYF